MRKLHRRNFNEPGHAHELTWSCYRGHQFLSKDRTCQWLADSINAAREELDFDLWAYVFMPEHVHLIVHPGQPVYRIEDIRQAIKEPCARDAIDWMSSSARRYGTGEPGPLRVDPIPPEWLIE